MELRVPGPGADRLVELLPYGLAETEFSISGQIVADINLSRPPNRNNDGSISLQIEALTVSE